MKNKALIIIAVILVLFTIGINVFYDDFRYALSSIMQSNKFCFPDSSKNKVTVLIAKDGIYDNEKMSSQVSEYFDSVKKDLNIDNVGLKKFDGKTVEELDWFVDEIYTNDDVGYIILVGEDLPIVTEQTVKIISINDTAGPVGGIAICLVNDSKSGEAILEVSAAKCEPGKYKFLDPSVDEKISCINGSCRVITQSCESEVCPVRKGSGGYYRCRNVGISYIIPPPLYSDEEKVDFVSKILKTYSNYHNNFNIMISKYQKSVLIIEMAESVTSNPRIGYDLPTVALAYTEGEKISNELKDKHLILVLGAHGAPEYLQFGIGIPNQVSISLDEYSNFVKENGLPALFVDARQSHNIKIGYEDLKHCCWPQIFMESGVWAYYPVSSGEGTKAKFTHEKTIGLAVRKSSPTQAFIFGDILAHMK